MMKPGTFWSWPSRGPDSIRWSFIVINSPGVLCGEATNDATVDVLWVDGRISWVDEYWFTKVDQIG